MSTSLNTMSMYLPTPFSVVPAQTCSHVTVLTVVKGQSALMGRSGTKTCLAAQQYHYNHDWAICRDQCVHFKSVTAKCVSMHVEVPYACRRCFRTARAGWVLTMQAVSCKGSEPESRSSC